ncbi:MAG TPA: hypothetical protein VFH20_14265 [Propionibacteriaceae bacterium]|nr:hypothetical protein [Propionibacteriaceae bacterium]
MTLACGARPEKAVELEMMPGATRDLSEALRSLAARSRPSAARARHMEGMAREDDRQ